MEKFDTISSELRFQNPYWEYMVEKYVLPDKSQGDYHYVNSRGSTMIIPRHVNNTFTLIRQYRYLNKKYSLEFPGGGLKKGLAPEENAREELKEESGLVASTLTLIGEFNPYNGVTNEICHTYLASGLVQTGNAPEPSEELEIVRLSYEQIVGLIKQGEIWDGMTLAAWALYVYQDL